MTNNQQGELLRQLTPSISCDERKCHSEPSELAERKPNRPKRKDLRNAYKLISGLCLLFSSKRVRRHCGVRHNADLNLNICEAMHIADERMYENKNEYYNRYPELKYR